MCSTVHKLTDSEDLEIIFNLKIPGSRLIVVISGKIDINTRVVRIDNSFPLETQAQERNLNPDSESLQAAGPMDPGNTQPLFLGTEPPQAEAPAKSQSQNIITGLTMIMPKEELLELPNEGRGILCELHELEVL
ncbi:hypothetical protein DSO57_1015540 [Entomophthora muscae]|uniref:Uncharacterized protein n=1 Tax=Entomophthora muscae TaxID=34485 RepID=A0ACC2S776_9FUNG|nr:hypothetical protein DSO57_1015540 [Entomophthora muscae]